jgi:hypothetical protein
MAYLYNKDYAVSIQDVNIAQIINADESIRLKAQLAGEAEAQSYLKQKYNVAREFQDLGVFVYSNTYYAYNRAYLDAPIYDTTQGYTLNVLRVFSGNVYRCTTAITAPAGAFDPTKWAIVGAQYAIVWVKPQYPEFNYEAYYNIGDQVYYNNKTYTCRVQTPLLSHDTALQYREIKNLPAQNVAPDDPISGVEYWGSGTPFSVSSVWPNASSFWVFSDPRDAQMVLYLCDLVLYHLHARIAPRNIPELRVKRYDDAIEWLKMCAEGNVTPNLPLISPKQGNRIRYGGGIRQINSY